MTNFNPPPPIYAPPSPEQNRRSCLIAAAIVMGAAICLIGAIAFGAFKFTELTGSDPKPLPGYGNPKMEKKLAGTWALYLISELELRLALPEKPRPETPLWTPEHRLVVKGWSNYTLDSDYFSFDLDGYEFRIPYDLDELADEQKDVYSEMDTLKNVESKKEKVKIDGKEALLQTLTYEMDKLPSITKVYYLNHRGRSLSLNFHYWRSNAADATKQVDRVLKSVDFDSP